MSRINSKKKGSRFERVVCKAFTEWSGYEFSRTPQSGGLRWKKADNISSDVVCTDPIHNSKCPFSIECKNHQSINFEHPLLGNKNCKIKDFWDQATNDANRANKVPLLIIRYNSMSSGEAFFAVGPELHEYMKAYIDNYTHIHTPDGLDIVIYLLSEVMDSIQYNAFYKFARKLLKKG